MLARKRVFGLLRDSNSLSLRYSTAVLYLLTYEDSHVAIATGMITSSFHLYSRSSNQVHFTSQTRSAVNRTFQKFLNTWIKVDICGTSASRPNLDSSSLRHRNLNTAFSLWKRIKCVSTTLRLRDLRTDVSLSKRIELFPSIPRLRNLQTWQSQVILDLFEENSGREITWLSSSLSFRKTPFSKCFPSTLKHKTRF